MNSNTITIKDLARKYLGDYVDSDQGKYIFYDNSCNLYNCVTETNNNPRLNDFLEEYLKTCNNINQRDSFGWSALHHSSFFSRNHSTDRTVEILINAGANVNLQTICLSTALHFAAQNCAAQNCDKKSTKRTVELLIQADADVFNLKNMYSKAPIDYFSEELLEYFQINKDAQTIGIKSGKLTKRAMSRG